MTPNWVLVRGLIREAAHWGTFPELLQKAYPGSRVHCLDLPGNGQFFQETTPLGIDRMVQHLRDQMVALRASEDPKNQQRWIAVSISLGAMVTARWVNLHPTDLDAAVLINTSFRGVSPIYRRMSPAVYWRLLRIFFESDVAEREQRILDLTTKAVREPQTLHDRVEAQRRHPLRRTNAIRQIISAAAHPAIRKPNIPTLILNSLGDQMVHPDCSDAIRKKWQVPMKRHAWAGHDLPLDDPKWTLTAIQEWLQESPVIDHPSQLANRTR